MPGTGLVTLDPRGDYETPLLSGKAGIAAQFRVAVKPMQYNAAVKNTGFGIRLSRIWVPGLPFSNYMVLGRSPYISKSHVAFKRVVVCRSQVLGGLHYMR